MPHIKNIKGAMTSKNVSNSLVEVLKLMDKPTNFEADTINKAAVVMRKIPPTDRNSKIIR
jgi:hypothetical protein